MKTLLRRALLIAALATLPVILNCSDTTEPTNRFDLILTNNSTTAYEIWVNIASAGFVASGNITATSQVTLRNLIINTNYVFRLSTTGTGPNTFAYEMTVNSTGADVTWTVP